MKTAKMNYTQTDGRTEKRNYMQTDKHREDEWTRGIEMTSPSRKRDGQWTGKERNEDRNWVGGSESYRESSDKESETEYQKILSSPLWMPTMSSNNPSNAVGEQRGVTRSRPAGNIKNNFFSLLGGCNNGERFCQPKQQAKVTSYKSSFSFHKNLQNQIIVVQFDNKNAKTPNLSWYNDRKKFSKKKMQLLTHLWPLLMPICFIAIATWPICIFFFFFSFFFRYIFYKDGQIANRS